MKNNYPTIKCAVFNNYTQHTYLLKNQKMEENELKISTKTRVKKNLSKKSPHEWNHLAFIMHNFSFNLQKNFLQKN